MESELSADTEHVLPAERERASFVTEAMTNILDNGADQTKKRRFILSMTEDLYKDVEDKYNWSRAEYLQEHVRSFIEIHEDYVGKWKPTRYPTSTGTPQTPPLTAVPQR